jgi:hypothetical protein
MQVNNQQFKLVIQHGSRIYKYNNDKWCIFITGNQSYERIFNSHNEALLFKQTYDNTHFSDWTEFYEFINDNDFELFTNKTKHK